MAIREKSGPDAVYWLGSAKFSNEEAYLFRKLAAFWGTNNVDHAARICHSTTVAGLANTWGYGAMTNSFNDIRNSKTMLILGGNPAEAHPVSLQHILEGKELNRANVIVIDPRMTRTAAHATDYVRMRPGTDIAVIYGMLWHIFKNGWEDKEFIRQRVYGMDDVRKEVEKWTPEEVERVTGIPEAQLKRVAETFAKQKPSCLIWAMGQTQHTVGTANVRASCILLMATGSVGGVGNGANPFRGHDNVQGASDMGLDIASLPLYYGITEGAWKHWCRVWEIDYDWVLSRFESKRMMETPGIPATRWFDAATLPKDQVEQKDNIKAHAGLRAQPEYLSRASRTPRAGSKSSTCSWFAIRIRRNWAVLGERKNGTYLLPSCTQYESRGTRTASNGSLQPYEQIVKPIFESKHDGEIIYLLATKLGLADQVFKGIKTDDNGAPLAEDVLSEINRGGWSTGYTGQSPERLKAHLRNQAKFDPVTLRAPKDDPEVGGDYYGLPWPCWGKPELKHPGTPILYNTNLHVMEGGGTFRARFGVERDVKLPDGTDAQGQSVGRGVLFGRLGNQGRLSGVHLRGAQETRLGQGSQARGACRDRARRRQQIRMPFPGRPIFPAASSAWRFCTAASPFGNAKARANAFGLPDADTGASRADLHAASRSWSPNTRRCRTRNSSGCRISASTCRRRRWTRASPSNSRSSSPPAVWSNTKAAARKSRSNAWLAELQQDMFIEINPADAAERGIKNRDWVLVSGPEMASDKACRMKAIVTPRMAKGVTWCPFHFAGWFQGEDLRSEISARHRSHRAGRERQHDHDLRLRPGDRHAGAQGHALSGQSGIRRRDHGSDEISLRRRSLHRMQRLRHRLQERTRSAVGHQPPACRHHQ